MRPATCATISWLVDEPGWLWSWTILALISASWPPILFICACTKTPITSTKAVEYALARAWACSGLELEAVMVRAPVVGSTVPVTPAVAAATSGLPRSFAAWSWTAVLPSSWTGSGRVIEEAAAPPWAGVLICTSALDW